MKPRTPFMQTFDKLPEKLPLYPLENALLPGGELPLEISEPHDLALFLHALKADQLIGMVQPRHDDSQQSIYELGCAGRVRQYRERSDGRLNVMLTGICRYRIVDKMHHEDGYTLARVDWTGFENDYETEDVAPGAIADFKQHLRGYFDRHSMQVDWEVLDKSPIEKVVNNLVLVINLDTASKQKLLESRTVSQRLGLFSELLENTPDPILTAAPENSRVN